MPTTPPLSPAVAAATRAVDAATLAADLAFIAQPRNHLETPEHLAAVAAHVSQVFRAAGYATSRQPVQYQGASADNVVAEKRGRAGAAGRIVYVCAHYDAVPGSPGADDNASAVAGMLAVARALAAVPMDATVRFAAFAFEEYGLTGSQTHVQSLPGAEVARIAGVLDLEMIGYVKTGKGSQEFPPGAGMFADEPLPTEGDFIGVVGLSGQPEPLASLRALHDAGDCQAPHEVEHRERHDALHPDANGHLVVGVEGRDLRGAPVLARRRKEPGDAGP